MEIINWDVLGAVLIGSAIVAKLLNAIKALAGSYYAELSDKRKELCGMGVVVVGAGLIALTGLDALPGFSAVVPWAGRVLTCIIAGFGPGLVYDVAMDRPKPLVPQE